VTDYQCTSVRFIKLSNRIESNWIIFPRIGMLYCRKISVCLSGFHTQVCVLTAKPILNLLRPSGSGALLFGFICMMTPEADAQFQGEPVSGGVKYTEWDNFALFDFNRQNRKRCDIGRWLLCNINRKSWLE